MLKILLFILFSVLTSLGHAQVRIIQWTDAHSSLETMGRQLLAIDHAGQEFLREHPKGEVIVYVVGDFTSLTPDNIHEGGWLSLRALKILKERGYTVLFTPGNHDAFDWTVKIDGAQLFLRQMQQLKKWGIRILVENLRKKSEDFARLVQPHYRLRTLRPKTHVVGLTLPIIMTKSNLTDDSAKLLFGKIETYEETFKRLLPEFERQGLDAVIFGVHQGHESLARQLNLFQDLQKKRESSIRVPLMLSAHDHLAASYRHKGTHISGAASHGSISWIDLNSYGEVLSSEVRHLAISDEKMREVNPDFFLEGRILRNDLSRAETLAEPWLRDYQLEIDRFREEAQQRLSRVRTHLQRDLDQHKMHMKEGPTLLGGLLGEALVRWARETLYLKPSTPVIAMSNSSSYRLEEGLKSGPLREIDFRRMYPYLTEAAIYRLSGQQITDLYFSLRTFYANGNSSLFSPQVNLTVRESGTSLEYLDQHGVWHQLRDRRHYHLVLDGWLADHRLGQSYKIKTWLETLRSQRPIAVESYQDLLVEYLPRVIEAHQSGAPLQPPRRAPLMCRVLFL